MSNPAPFTICKLKQRDNAYFYVTFRDAATGRRGTKKSIDKLKAKSGLGFAHVTRKEEAVLIANTLLEQKQAMLGKPETTSLRSFLLEFFDWDHSPYYVRRRMLDADSVSPDYVSTRRNLIANHLIPLIDRNMSVQQVTTPYLEQLQQKLADDGKLAHATINLIMGALGQALGYAQKLSLLPADVIIRIENLSAGHKIRGILDQSETQRLIAYLDGLSDRRPYLSCCLSLLTGMRSGELRALRTSQIHDGMIAVDAAYANIAGMKLPKGKKARTVPCPSWLCEQLVSFAKQNPYATGLVFWSRKSGGPVSSHYFSTQLHKALSKADILTAEEIETRNISFHSLRHMANTLLRGSVDEYLLRLTIGHSSEALSDMYTHISDNALASLRTAQEQQIMPFLSVSSTVDGKE